MRAATLPALPAGGVTAPPATSRAAAEPEARAPGSGARRAFSFPFAAPTRADLRQREAAKGPAAEHPSGRGATLDAPAADLAALVAVTLFIAALVLWLGAAAGGPGAV